MARKRARSPASETPIIATEAVFFSEQITDRDSTFQGLYSPSLSAASLQGSSDIKSASHKIAAWRKPSKQQTLNRSTTQSSQSSQSLYEVGHDDDGEKWAGKKLETLLVQLKVEGCVVVARWYGGTMLGPVRFTHIENCAKEAISKWQEAEGEAYKRRKVEAEEKDDKLRLEKTLVERDKSIVILRDLLATKRREKDTVASSSQQQVEAGKPSPAKPLDYTQMPVQALRRLEKARDATLGFILKEIDKMESSNKVDA